MKKNITFYTAKNKHIRYNCMYDLKETHIIVHCILLFILLCM